MLAHLRTLPLGDIVRTALGVVITAGFGLCLLVETLDWIMAKPKRQLLYALTVLLLVCLLVLSITLDLFLARSVLRMERMNNEQWKIFFWFFLKGEETYEEESPPPAANFSNTVSSEGQRAGRPRPTAALAPIVS